MFSDNSTFPRVISIRKFDIFFLRILIFISFIFSICFYVYLFNNASSGSVFLFSLVLVVLGFRIFKLWLEWYHYWSPSIPVPPLSKKIFTVDVFTTYCDGEPIEMVLKTLQAIKKINYPHSTFLCDESNNSFLKDFCFKNQIIYVTRTDKNDAKAGNINNALKNSTSDLVLILDPDHIPVPEFLDRLVPYFEDSEIGYVQCIQSYYNQNESIIARASAEQSFHFYGPMMMTMNSYGTVQAIGANCLFRRSALDSIGGHAPGLAEDMHTAMRLQAKGWKSVYVPEVLSKGLTPSTVVAYFKQQLKWSRGVFELLFRVFPLLFSKFTLRQKFHYITSSVFFLSGLFQLLEFIVPIIALFFSIASFKVDVSIFVYSYLILSLLSYLIRIKVQKWLPEESERGFHIWGGILLMGSWWVFLTGFIYSLFNINVPYIPTPKNDTKQNNWLIFMPNLFIIVISFFAIAFGLSRDYT
ncbi:MAG: glycosyltransferase family 2 protein, partial [Bacteroidota bacterium]